METYNVVDERVNALRRTTLKLKQKEQEMLRKIAIMDGFLRQHLSLEISVREKQVALIEECLASQSMNFIFFFSLSEISTDFL